MVGDCCRDRLRQRPSTWELSFCMACRLTLFGPPRLLDDQGMLIPVPAKTFALIAYLLLANGGGPAGRGSLRQFLWENSDAKTAATNLRKFLLRIRQRQEAF